MLGKRPFAVLYSPSAHEFSDPSYIQRIEQRDSAAVTSTSLPSTPRSRPTLKPAFLDQFVFPTTSSHSLTVTGTRSHCRSSSINSDQVCKRQRTLSTRANSLSSGACSPLPLSPMMDQQHIPPIPSSPSTSSFMSYRPTSQQEPQQAGPSNIRLSSSSSSSPPPISSATRMDTNAFEAGTTTFQLPPLHRRPKPRKTPAKTLSLHIPAGLGAYGGLTNPPMPAATSLAEPISHEASHVSRPAIDLQDGAHRQLLRLPQAPKSARKRPIRLDLSSQTTHTPTVNNQAVAAHSVPNSPKVGPARTEINVSHHGTNTTALEERGKLDLRLSLTGKPRRRPSMPFGQNIHHSSREDLSSTTSNALSGTSSTPSSAAFPNSSRPPEAWRDPSEHILSGKGSTLQHARSVYAAGPIEVLPGLFLGDEHNAKDDHMLSHFGITTILNVAKETVLPIQSAKGVTDLRQARPGSVALKSRPYFDINGSQANPTRPPPPMRAFSVSVSEREQFYTPATSRFPPGDLRTPARATFNIASNAGEEDSQLYEDEEEDAFMTPVQQSPVARQADNEGPYLLRTISSTPNLQTLFDGKKDANETDGPHSRPATAVGAESDSSQDEVLSHAPLVNGDAGSRGDHGDTSSPESMASSLLLTSEIELPADAVTLSVPANASLGRLNPLRYIKLPWTHDQTELATPMGGFAQGCAVIADAMGVDYYGRKLVDENGEAVKPSKVLVHCQCGVSRSATLVIAFVMQAAALNYPWDTSKNLTGMHDCYNLVKELSSSISPNISLIYQLVEWERHLSAEATRLREALKAQSPEGRLLGLSDQPNGGQGGWTVDVLDEEEWTRMRREEEAKEEAEEQIRREKANQEAEQRKLSQRQEQQTSDLAAGNGKGTGSAGGVEKGALLHVDPSANTNGGLPLTPTRGLGARRAKKAPSLRLGNSLPTANGDHAASITPMPKTPHALNLGVGHSLPGEASGQALDSARHDDFSFPGTSKAIEDGVSPKIDGASSMADSPRRQYANLDAIHTDIAKGAHSSTPTLASHRMTPADLPSPPTDELLMASDRRSDRPQSLYAKLPSDRGSVQDLQQTGAATGMRYSASTGSQQQRSQPPSTSSKRHSTHAPSSFHLRGHRGTHTPSSSISSLQSIHGTLSASSSNGQLVSPKANFGMSRGLTSAERRLQHRRTFSSEANQFSAGGGLINWDQIRGAVAAAKDKADQS